MIKLLPILLLTMLSGCLFISDAPLRAKGPSIAEAVDDLPEVAMPEVRMPPPTREDVMTAYRDVYGLMPNSRENQAVGKRLADLEMEIGEEKDIEGRAEPYAAAISLYEELLAGVANEDRDQILYQLARAYDVVGERQKALDYLDRMIAEHPDSAYMIEARFRRAEMLFSDENYTKRNARTTPTSSPTAATPNTGRTRSTCWAGVSSKSPTWMSRWQASLVS